jgi:hypothetical protein
LASIRFGRLVTSVSFGLDSTNSTPVDSGIMPNADETSETCNHKEKNRRNHDDAEDTVNEGIVLVGIEEMRI